MPSIYHLWWLVPQRAVHIRHLFWALWPLGMLPIWCQEITLAPGIRIENVRGKGSVLLIENVTMAEEMVSIHIINIDVMMLLAPLQATVSVTPLKQAAIPTTTLCYPRVLRVRIAISVVATASHTESMISNIHTWVLIILLCWQNLHIPRHLWGIHLIQLWEIAITYQEMEFLSLPSATMLQMFPVSRVHPQPTTIDLLVKSIIIY